MQPTEILMQEHRVIEQVLSCLEKLAEAGSRDGRIEAAVAADAIDFLRVFADRFHHAKEEENLFPMMEARGFSPDLGPTAVMRQDHEAGRALVARMAEAVNGASEGQATEVRAFVESAMTYVSLLREHIQREDQCLFPMADQALRPEDQQAQTAAPRRPSEEEVVSSAPAPP